MPTKKAVKVKRRTYSRTYPSSTVLLNIALKEYDSEEERGKSIDNRTGILLSAVVVLLTFYLPNLKIKELTSLQCVSLPQSFIWVFYAIFMISAVICLIFLLKTISVKKYDRFLAEDIANEVYHKKQSDTMEFALAEKACHMLKKNTESNNAKIRYYSWSIYALIIMLFSIFVSLIMSSFLL